MGWWKMQDYTQTKFNINIDVVDSLIGIVTCEQRLVSLSGHSLWEVITPQTLWWKIGDESRPWSEKNATFSQYLRRRRTRCQQLHKMTSRSFRKDAVFYMRLYTTQGHIPRSIFAISHNLGAHTAAFDVVLDASDADDDDQLQQQQQQPTQQDDNTRASTTALNDTQSDDTCEVCPIAARTDVTLVPCGHSRFCASCSRYCGSNGQRLSHAVLQCRWFFVYSISRNSASC